MIGGLPSRYLNHRDEYHLYVAFTLIFPIRDDFKTGVPSLRAALLGRSGFLIGDRGGMPLRHVGYYCNCPC